MQWSQEFYSIRRMRKKKSLLFGKRYRKTDFAPQQASTGGKFVWNIREKYFIFITSKAGASD